MTPRERAEQLARRLGFSHENHAIQIVAEEINNAISEEFSARVVTDIHTRLEAELRESRQANASQTIAYLEVERERDEARAQASAMREALQGCLASFETIHQRSIRSTQQAAAAKVAAEEALTPDAGRALVEELRAAKVRADDRDRMVEEWAREHSRADAAEKRVGELEAKNESLMATIRRSLRNECAQCRKPMPASSPFCSVACTDKALSIDAHAPAGASDVVEESPSFTPETLKEFSARGFERTNRHKDGSHCQDATACRRAHLFVKSVNLDTHSATKVPYVSDVPCTECGNFAVTPECCLLCQANRRAVLAGVVRPDWVPWPVDKPKRYLTGTACDMLRGPCACGATHDGDEK